MEDTDLASNPEGDNIGESSLKHFFNDLRRPKVFGRLVMEAKDAKTNVLRDLFLTIYSDQLLLITSPYTFFSFYN